MILSNRFEEAFSYACRLHRQQVRKGSRTPYIAHLIAVAGLVLEDGGTEDEAIAALLHDAPEDQGGEATLDEIQVKFGVRVADIVEGCSDTFSVPKPPWRQRKEAYLAHLRTASREVRRVSMADKLHNARSILDDLRRDGESVWNKFNGGKQGTLWYYRELADFFSVEQESPMVTALEETVRRIEEIALCPETD